MPDDLPYLRFREPVPVTFDEKKKRSGGMHKPSREEQWKRVGPELKNLQESLERRTLELSETAPGAAAEDVLVFELAGAADDFFAAVRATEGMEWLADTEEELPYEDAAGFGVLKKGQVDSSKEIKEYVYLVATNAAALGELLSAWERKSQRLPLKRSLSKFGNVLEFVINIRPWSWQDRLREEELDHWRELLEHGDATFRFEIELWYRNSSTTRQKAEDKLSREVEALGGRVIRPFVHEGCGYHGLCVELPAVGAQELLANRETAELFQQESVFHFWPTGQAIAADLPEDGGENAEKQEHPLPTGDPEVALFDGLPVEKHFALDGRLVIEDLDGFSDDYPVEARVHGTQMASLIVCGNLDENSRRLPSPLFVIPILRAFYQYDDKWHERIPDDTLPLDLLQRAVIRLRESAPRVKVINLSIGDSARPFLGSPSAWARMLDWLQSEYGLLFVISAGNRCHLASPYSTAREFEDAEDAEIERALIQSVLRNRLTGRLLSPAESINALTVGACHQDPYGDLANLPPGTRIPIRFSELPSPLSCIGPGNRRSVKPDFLMTGGRQPLRHTPMGDSGIIEPVKTIRPPGLKVAAPPQRTIHTRGSSVAAALATRRCAFLFDELRAMHETIRPDEEYFVVLAKALCVHPACWKDADGYLRDLLQETPGRQWSAWKRKMVTPLLGHGVVDQNSLMLGRDNQVTLLAWGWIEAEQTWKFEFPLPPSMSGREGKKRVTSTVAWFTPIHPGHARYRKAKLTLLPTGDNLLGIDRRNGESNQLVLGTVHHEVFEGDEVRGLAVDAMPLHLTCSSDAGELQQPIRFGLAVTLEVAPDLFTGIYEEIREMLAVPVAIRTS